MADKDLIMKIHRAAGGRTVIPALMSGTLYSKAAERALVMGKSKLKNAIRLTKREKEVMALIAKGLSNKEIAVKLKIETFEVKGHAQNIMDKLALHTSL